MISSGSLNWDISKGYRDDIFLLCVLSPFSQVSDLESHEESFLTLEAWVFQESWFNAFDTKIQNDTQIREGTSYCE